MLADRYGRIGLGFMLYNNVLKGGWLCRLCVETKIWVDVACNGVG